MSQQVPDQKPKMETVKHENPVFNESFQFILRPSTTGIKQPLVFREPHHLPLFLIVHFLYRLTLGHIFPLVTNSEAFVVSQCQEKLS